MTTGDGSLTFYSEEFGQAFHNTTGAHQEALEKFVRPTGLEELAIQQVHINLLDVCFGLGYNSGVAVETIHAIAPTCEIHLIGLERSPDVPQQAIANGILFGIPEQWISLVQDHQINASSFSGQLFWGDARRTLVSVPVGWADAVFFDPFSPSVCPELWTVDFLQQVRQRMKPTARLATYSCGAAIRQAMLEAGFQIGSTSPVGRPWPGTVASPQEAQLPPLSAAEQEHLHTRAAIPYRDPTLQWSRDQIKQDRQYRQQQSPLEPTGVWKRRWEVERTTPIISPE
ncbi:MAG: hypothetical protein HC818_00645 [Synechococcaceae cyanobacterium RM1_1_27]|nr:hypothetical protein [Synechococcaceae cyanobacterium SM2_3_2]NJO85395.1 hypothetical protein [Synechococcaceae cyanobacterium RM1_1_27]